MKRLLLTVPFLVFAACGGSDAPEAQQVSEQEHVASENAERLIPRKILFGNPEKVMPQISPDGTMIAYVAPVDGVMNLWVMNRDFSEPRQITFDTNRGVTNYFWAENNTDILYMQDQAGEENTHVYRLNVATGDLTDLTPFEGVKAYVSATDRDQPDRVLIEMNRDDPMFFDVYECDLETGELTMVADNPGLDDNGDMVLGFVEDEDMNVRMYYAINPDNGFITVYHRWNGDSDWEELVSFSSNDKFEPRRFSEDGKGLYVVSNLDSDLTALYYLDLGTGEQTYITSDSLTDVGGVSFDPFTGEPRSVSYNYLRRRRVILDDSIAPDMEFLTDYRAGDFGVSSADNADSTWIVVYYTVENPAVYFLYDRKDKSMQEIFTAIPALADYQLAEVEPVEIEARDGLTLPSYLTIPNPDFYGDGPYPMVMYVHGGPWARDSYGYRPFAQLFANRGFAVLQVNFRGSEGFGKEFLNAGNKQWGRKMQDDITDGVYWAVENGIADPDRVVILGGSYGGYATLAGAAFTPELYCAAVDFFGPSNLITFMKTVPPYWKPLKAMMDLRVGNPENPEDSLMLVETSPVNYADNMTMPMFIVQGENDPRVVKAESDQMVEALREIGTDVLYVVYADEGHGFAHEENRLDFAGRVEEFLFRNVQGVECELFEPVEGSTATVE